MPPRGLLRGRAPFCGGFPSPPPHPRTVEVLAARLRALRLRARVHALVSWLTSLQLPDTAVSPRDAGRYLALANQLALQSRLATPAGSSPLAPHTHVLQADGGVCGCFGQTRAIQARERTEKSCTNCDEFEFDRFFLNLSDNVVFRHCEPSYFVFCLEIGHLCDPHD